MQVSFQIIANPNLEHRIWESVGRKTCQEKLYLKNLSQTISFIFPDNFKNSSVKSIHLCICISKQRTHSMKISLKLIIAIAENICGMLCSQSNMKTSTQHGQEINMYVLFTVMMKQRWSWNSQGYISQKWWRQWKFIPADPIFSSLNYERLQNYCQMW